MITRSSSAAAPTGVADGGSGITGEQLHVWLRQRRQPHQRGGVNGTTTASYSYDDVNQVVGWSYDQAGNLTSDGSTSYSYDALNRLTGSTATGQSRAYSYNGDGTLVNQTANGTATSYVQDLAGGLSQVLASTTGGATTDYLYGQDRLTALTSGTCTLI